MKKCSRRDIFTFTALDDFTNTSDPETQLEDAREFGIRIVKDNGIKNSDWRVVKGPYWRFRRRASTLLFGHDDKDDFFIRKVEATKKSNIRLYYYDLAKGKEAIIEINRRPGLCLTFRSGTKPGLRCDVYSFCTRENTLRFISFGRHHDVV
jgi:hypothetical protein